MNGKILVFLAILLLVGLGCQLTRSVTVPVTHHPQPQMDPIDTAPFQQAGCTPSQSGTWECPADNPFLSLGCDQLRQPPALLGALDPSYPLVECLYYPLQHQDTTADPRKVPHLYNDGCMMPIFVNIAIQQDGEFKTIHTPEDLSQVYAPIESPEEALSYALAATGLSAYYDLSRQPSFRYFVDQLEDTHVVETGDGYTINLYRYAFCGCGPHTTSIVNVQVSHQGEVQISDPVPAFENPEEDGLCVD